MNIFAISDLHLALSITDKSMELFGSNWDNYINRIADNWNNKVKDEDVVIMPGDSSWAMRLEDIKEDLDFIEALPGKKLIFKGNHDYWWSTQKKLNEYLNQNDYKSIVFMQNKSYKIDELDAVICGTRGWINPVENGFNADDGKIYSREVQRLEISLNAAKNSGAGMIIAALHYPPLFPNNEKSKKNSIIDLLLSYDVRKCVFGHIHSSDYLDNKWEMFLNGEVVNNTEFLLVSSDMISFDPIKIL